MTTKELIPATETTAATDFRPIYAWPPLKAKEWKAAKEVLPGITRPNMQRVEMRGPNPPGKKQRSMILVPCSALPELDSDGPELHVLEDKLAEVLDRRQLRYGKQKRPQGHRPGYFVGFSGKLAALEWQLCYDNKLYQREGNFEPISNRPIVNDDGSQTFEYQDYPSRDSDFRLEKLHELVMGTIAPQIGRLIASNVEIPLELTDEVPSLFEQSSQMHS